jgi:hypothetical protein
MQDLFETPEKIPQEVSKVLDLYILDEFDYIACQDLKNDLEKIGFTIDYELDAIPYNLRKTEQITHLK